MDTKNAPGSKANRWAGYFIIAIAVLHTVFFVPHPYWADWLSGGLWGGKAPENSVIGFWALPGGFVAVLALLGLLIVRLGRRGEYIPAYVGWGMGVWCVCCIGLIGPSGFMLGLVPAALLIRGNLAARRHLVAAQQETGQSQQLW